MNGLNNLFKVFAFIPLFASRPFLTGFVAAAASASWPTYFPAPEWFVLPVTIVALGGLALFEFLARLNVTLRFWFDQFDTVFKSVVSLVVTYALVDPESAALATQLAGDAAVSTQTDEGQTVFSYIWSTISAAGTWYVSTVRRSFMGFLSEVDEDDDLGLQGLIHWLESLGVGFGAIIALIFPVVVILFYGGMLIFLYWWQKRMDEAEKAQQVICAHCQTSHSPLALQCPSCAAKAPSVNQVGFLGQATSRPVINRGQHRYDLSSKRRCPQCATRLPQKAVQQTCGTCQTVVFQDRQALESYFDYLDSKLMGTMLISFGFSLIPLLGIIPGVLYYRLGLVSGVRRYVPSTVGCVTRFGVRFLNLLILMCQPLPVIGWFALPAMVWSNYYIYKRVLRRQAEALKAKA